MKICYVCPDLGISLDGTKGASAHVRGLVRAFGALGHEVLVVAGKADSDGGLGVPVEIVPRPATHQGLRLEDSPKVVRALGHLWNNIELEHVLERVFRTFQPDLVYERHSPFGGAAGQVARAHGLPHILEVNALLAEEGEKFRGQALGEACALLENVAFRSAGMIVTVSDTLREGVLERGAGAEAVLTVPNGVDTALFSPRGQTETIGQPEDTVIGFVGSLKPWHGIERIARLFRILAAEPGYHLVVVGDGPERKHIRILAEEFPGRVTLAPDVAHHEVPAFVRAMDIALAPYPPMESFYFSPLKILEYMACGSAIVASALGQVEDLLVHRETGLLVPASDDEALLAAIRELRGDPELCRRLGATASALAHAGHDWTHRAREILAHQERLAAMAGNLHQEVPHA